MSSSRRLLGATLLAVGLAFVPSAAAPPANDDCSGAIPIPDGPYPVVTAQVEAAEATPQGVDDGGLFPAACNSQGTDYTVWYTFTPSVSTAYTFTTCPASGATSETVLDTVIAIFSSSDGTCGGTFTSLACNDSAACSSGGDRSLISAVLTAGTTYYVVAGHWVPDGAIPASDATYQMVVTRSDAPSNDTCAGAVTLQLNQLAHGTTFAANDDYQTPATAACYPGNQFPTTAAGRDVVYTFTAPADGKYSARFRTYEVNSDTSGADVTLYAASNCPAGGGTVNCIRGGNHINAVSTNTTLGQNNNRAEELKCMSLTAGQQIWLFFDNSVGGAANPGGPFSVEVTPCVEEVEPNDSTATATPYSAAYCGTQEGSISAAPSYHCVLGPNNGLPCQATAAGAGVPAPSNCGGSPNQCWPDSVCESGPNSGAACVPRCVGGPTPGAICTQNVATTFCGTGGSCQVNGGCGVCTSGTNTGQPCVNNANCGTGGVCVAGVCDRNNNEGDIDYWSLGTPAAGSKVYAGLQAAASNDSNLRMRITNPANTIGFDEDDAASLDGSFSATIAGAKTDGTQTFVKVSKTTPFPSDIYQLYSVVEPSVAQAQAENGDAWDGNYQWPGDGLFDDPVNNGANGGYIKGTFFNAHDIDCYKMYARKGDDLIWFGDSNPDRANFQPTQGPSVPQTILYDALGGGITNFVFTTDTVYRNIGPAFTPGQTGNLPRINSFFQHWRAQYTGSFELCIYPYAFAFGTSPGPFPAPYTVSLTQNCAPMPNAGPGTTTADVAITMTGPAGPVPTSGQLTYTITITNVGNDLAQQVTLDDPLPQALRYLSATIDDGFGGSNTACLSLPNPGTADAPLNCTTMSIEAGASITYTLNVQVADCIGGGIDVTNTVTVSTESTDPNSANDSASNSFTTTENDSCSVLACDSNGCIVDHCYAPGTCNAGQCNATPYDCDDNNVCTADSCNPAIGCVNYPPLDGCYGDGNPCTDDACDPVLGCIFTPSTAGTPCGAGLPCSNSYACDGAGSCVACNDGNPCTDDSVDGASCTCLHVPGGPSPPEAQYLSVDANKQNFWWMVVANATSYDVVRGLLSGLPVGPGGGDETCFGGLAENGLVDAATPPPDAGYWYLARGVNESCPGTFGQRSDGTERATATCP